ncbi:hypothetical protein PORY_001181 [Pneumocystis oryctolagi]|uniref:Uncharacterized protein n=1 Tax=Pneumocystis oryctolagi TaxID=42067 RepID=A0ACB7CE24_9ASCO|nr:hypothetical protein PORY_001181 [Pneumocystis oryctolagi]
MSQTSLKLEGYASKMFESLVDFLVAKFNYINNSLCFLKKLKEITIRSYNSLENSTEDIFNNNEFLFDIYKNINDYSEKIRIIKDQMSILEHISKELNSYSKELDKLLSFLLYMFSYLIQNSNVNNYLNKIFI